MFNIISQANAPTVTDGIVALVQACINTHPVHVTCQTPPTGIFGQGIPTNHWVKVLRPLLLGGGRTYHPNPYTNGRMMADDAASWIHGQMGPTPGRVLIDEFRSDLGTDIDGFIDRWAEHCNYWVLSVPPDQRPPNSNWGWHRAAVALAAGTSYDYGSVFNGTGVLTRLMQSRIVVVAEMYAGANGSNSLWKTHGGAFLRSLYFGTGEVGGVGTQRLNYLVSHGGAVQNMARIPALQPYSGVPITVMLGATSTYTSGVSTPYPKMMAPFHTFAGGAYRPYIARANGGPGSWKWESPATSGSQDNDFASAWWTYS